MPLDQAHLDYLAEHWQGCLATVCAAGTPQNKPVRYGYNLDLGSIDIAGYGMETSAKYRNIAIRPDVSLVVDDAVGDGVEGMRFIEVRGRAAREVAEPGTVRPGLSPHIIRIWPRRVISWNIGQGTPGFQSFDLPGLPHERSAAPCE